MLESFTPPVIDALLSSVEQDALLVLWSTGAVVSTSEGFRRRFRLEPEAALQLALFRDEEERLRFVRFAACDCTVRSESFHLRDDEEDVCVSFTRLQQDMVVCKFSPSLSTSERILGCYKDCPFPVAVLELLEAENDVLHIAHNQASLAALNCSASAVERKRLRADKLSTGEVTYRWIDLLRRAAAMECAPRSGDKGPSYYEFRHELLGKRNARGWLRKTAVRQMRQEFVLFWQDETELRNLQEQLDSTCQSLNDKLAHCREIRAFFENAPVPMGVIELSTDDLGVRQVICNPALQLVVSEDILRCCQKAREARGPVMCESSGTLSSPSGHRVCWFSTWIAPMESKNRFCFVSTDITLQKLGQERLEDAVKRRTQQLEEALQAKSLFLAMMSHEMRTPLSGVIGCVELLRSLANLPREARDLVQLALACSNRLMTTINDLLELTKLLEGANQSLSLQPTTIDDLLDEVYSGLPISLAKKSNISLTFDISSSVPDVVMSDARALRHILVNLLANALKFSHSGGKVVLEVTARPLPLQEKSSFELTFCVRDTGIGIADNIKANIFQPFSQGEVSDTTLLLHTRKYEGIGLGLFICKKLADLLGARLWFESELGRGSSFYLVLNVTLPSSSPPSSQLPRSVFRGLIVVIVSQREVEKDLEVSSMLMLLTTILRRRGCVVHCKMTVLDAIGFLRDHGNQARVLILAPSAIVSTSLVESNRLRVIHLKNEAISQGVMFVMQLVRQAAEELLASRADTPLGSPLGTPPPAKPPLRVLVADDNLANRVILRKLLEGIGCSKVDVVCNGREAVEATRQNRYDVVLMDVMMPEMDGLEATRQILACRDKPTRPIIVGVTASTLADEQEHCLQSGMRAVLKKPIHKEQLRKMMHSFFKYPDE